MPYYRRLTLLGEFVRELGEISMNLRKGHDPDVFLSFCALCGSASTFRVSGFILVNIRDERYLFDYCLALDDGKIYD